jgi:uncharacterized protein YjbI with pentapeptide repeats
LGVGDKTIWDWVNLLVLPIILTAGGLWFTDRQNDNQLEIENKRAQAERDLAEQRTQDDALQAYLDQMSTLLLTKDLRESEEGSEVRSLARARTLTVLERLDPDRKTVVMGFLVESRLVQSADERDPLIGLSGADLRGVNLEGFDLSAAALDDAELNDAKLNGADLNEAELSQAELNGAELASAKLNGADLSEAELNGAALPDAELSYADLVGAELTNADLNDAKLARANLDGADLDEVNLAGANLSYADLVGAELTNADLHDAKLSYADLHDAKLEGASGTSEELLEQQEALLDGATMFDGQMYKNKPIAIPAGQHTAEFDPAFSFEVGEGWIRDSSETPNWLAISLPSEQGEQGEILGQVFFTTPSHVFDLSSPNGPTAAPAPETVDEFVSWFREHPSPTIEEPVPVRVGGVSGMRIDVTDYSVPRAFPREYYCDEQPCWVPLFTIQDVGAWIVGVEGGKDRYVILNVGGEMVVINVAGPNDNFDEFLPKAQKVLDTVEWTDE